MTVADYATSLYTSSANIMFVMLPIVFLGRVVYSNFFGSSEDHFDNLKTLVIYVVLIKGFQVLLPYLIDLPHLINAYYDASTKTTADEVVNAYARSEQSSSLTFDVLSFLDFITELLELVVSFLVDVLFLLFALITPIVILLSVMMNLGIGVKLLFGLFFILATWNVSLAACDVFLKQIAQNKTVELNMFIVGLSAVMLKIVAGATNMLLILKSQAASGVMKSLKMGMSTFSGGVSNFSQAGSKTTAYANGSYAGSGNLDAKLERMPPPNQAGTFAGVARAENRIKQAEIARQDMITARKNLGLDSKKSSPPSNAKSSSAQSASSSIAKTSSSSAESTSSFSGSSKMESSFSSNSSDNSSASSNSSIQSSENQSSNSSVSAESVSQMSGREAYSWSRSSENLSTMPTKELASVMNGFSSKKNADIPFTKENEPVFGGYKSAIADRTDFDRAYWNARNEIKNRQKSGDTEADEALQTGHIEKKKGRK